MTMSPRGSGSAHGGSTAPETAADLVRLGRAFLERQGIESPRLEAQLLVAHALGLERLKLILALDRPVTEEEVARARGLLLRRSKREPAAYLVGQREFYGRPFLVGPGVLIPRPETELLVDLARERLRPGQRRAGAWKPPVDAPDQGDAGQGHGLIGNEPVPSAPGTESTEGEGSVPTDGAPDGGTPDGRPTESGTPNQELPTAPRCIADVGTGSGCLAVSLALEIPGTRVLGVDISSEALDYARRNGEALGAEVEWIEGDGPAALIGRARSGFDLIVSNPPYVTRESAESLSPEVRDHEPGLALFAPPGDPDHWVGRLFLQARPLLRPGGTLLIELGHDQGERVLGKVLARGGEARLHADLEGIPRVLEIDAAGESA